MPVKLLFIGDIIGKPGREALSRELHRIVDRHMVDLVIANGENAAGGFGLTAEVAQDLFKCGIQMITSGNHIWDKKDSLEYIKREERIVRPANYPEGTPGRGSTIVRTPGGIKVGILNLEGRVFMNNLDCPFRCADREVAKLKEETPIVFVDFHAEATSEKISLAWYLDGRVSAVVGTHTHVQTADERILTGGTAFITDVGMTGPFDSVIGVKKEEAIQKFITQRPAKFEIAKRDIRINAVVIEVDETTGLAQHIERINIPCG
jgi:2',3'-cyclic-nucleotide 2'-phosphodiesterase